ncbi:MAG TPA: YdbH domain-containing protein [Caulobacteraceae bacterium]|nr:YdbH domain-containing protein [Caulobacteraceae bacterium]
MGRLLLVVLLAVLAALLVVLLTGYATRRQIAEQAVTGWLERRGVQAELSFERFDLDGFSGRLRAGPADDPDLIVERVEVDTAIGWWWNPGGFAVRPTRVRLVRPVVKARLEAGKLTFGSLDPIIQDFLKRPPQPDQRGPRVLVEDGEARVTTGAGLVRLFAEAEVNDGKLLRLDARLPATRLTSGEISAALTSATLKARTVGDRLTLSGSGRLAEFGGPGLGLAGAALSFEGGLPYPDMKTRRGDGHVRLHGELAAESLRVAGAVARNGVLAIDFEGASSGWIDTLRLRGAANLRGRASSVRGEGFATEGVELRLAAASLRLDRGPDGLLWSGDGSGSLAVRSGAAGGARLQAAALEVSDLRAASQPGGLQALFRTAARVERLHQGDLVLTQLSGAFSGDLVAGDRVSVNLTGDLGGRGAYAGLGPARSADDPSLRALKRAVSAFAIAAPGLRIALDDGAATVSAGAPVRLVPASGGTATITPRPGQPLFGPGAGFDLAVAGGGLPTLAARVSDYAVGAGGLRATGSVKTAISMGPVVGGAVDAAGVLRLGAGGGWFTASRCAAASAERLDLGENDVVDLAGRLCPAGAPLLRFADGGWSLTGRVEGLKAGAPFLQLAISDASGRVRANGSGGLSLEAAIAAATVADTAPERRFHPMRLAGDVSSRGGDWTGTLALSADGHRVADLTLSHNGDLGAGGLGVDARGLTFAEGGLQPARLSPLVEGVLGTAVAGAADFTGELAWTAEGVTSRGRLATDGLDFKSPAGPVSRLRTTVELTSLAPLTSAPGQVATVERVDAWLPLERVTATFQVTPEALRVDGGAVDVADGRVVVEGLTVPFDRARTTEGAARIEGVQLGRLVERSGYADRVTLDARVSGHLPFTFGPEGIRFQNGQLAAIQPGRLSMKRELLESLTEAAGGTAEPVGVPVPLPEPQFNAQEFAYQALEHLAFDVLSAEVNSLPERRLGVLFKLRGKYDPPERQEIRLTLADILSKAYMNRDLPLPSDTAVNLTLDTTLNLDQLLEDFAAFTRARRQLDRSEPVQTGTR